MSLWDRIRGWVQQDAKKLTVFRVADDHVDVPQPLVKIEAGMHYFRLWLAEMHLKRDVEWFKTWYPVAHSLVRFQFGQHQVEVANVAGPLKLNGVDVNEVGNVIRLNYPLTALMPFRGGVVEIMAGLFAMQGRDSVQTFLGVMEEFSQLLVVPQLSGALRMAGTVATGVEKLLGVTDGRLHLGLHQAFVAQEGGGNLLRPGYYAVVRAEEQQVPRSRLWIMEDRLRLGDTPDGSEHYREHPHMVFRIEGQSTRDDWDALTTIAEPRLKMAEARLQGKEGEAESFLRAAKVAVFLSPDLTIAHQRLLLQMLDKEYASLQGIETLGPGGGAPVRSLAALMQSAPPVASVARAPLRAEEVFTHL